MSYLLDVETHIAGADAVSRDVSSHVFPSINVSGNARVQLGDQYHDGKKDAVAHGQNNEWNNLRHLRIAAALLDLLDFSCDLLSRTDGPFKSTDGQSLPSSHFRAAYDGFRTRCLALSASVEGRVGPSEPVFDHILTDAVIEGSEVVERVGSAFNPILSSCQHEQYYTFPEAFRAAGSEELSVLMPVFALLRKRVLFGLLIAMGPYFMRERWQSALQVTQSKLRAQKRSEHVILETLQSMQDEYAGEMEELYGVPSTAQANESRKVSEKILREESARQSADPAERFEALFGLSKSRPVGSLRGSFLSWVDLKSQATAMLQNAEPWYTSHQALVSRHAEALSSRLALERNAGFRPSLLQSLAFPEMDRRYHAVRRAEARTLDWVLDDTPDVQSCQQNFAQWLQDPDPAANRLYWISGKPGSGKSTMMRYLVEHGRTRAVASTWAAKHKLLIAKCFFWNSGTPLQKSQEGLLQTLLYQLLTQYPSFHLDVFHSRWTKSEFEGSPSRDPWTLAELRNAIFAFAEHHSAEVRILMILDGLDEFHGDNEQRQEVCSLLKLLSANPGIKICASSRLWNVYKDAFKMNPQLQLECLTRTDIRHYVEDHFYANDYFKDWAETESVQAEHLISSVVTRAQGVFLWVRLVVRSLITGLQSGDSARDLSRRLDEIPTDLEQYFLLMMHKLPPFYLDQASQLFEMALDHNHLVIVYYFIFEADEGVHSVTQLAKQAFTANDILQKQTAQERRIRARCVDLLEFHASEPGLLGQYHVVDFIHRTAKDFVASLEIQALLASWRKSRFDTQEAILRALVNMVVSCDFRHPWMSVKFRLRCLITTIDLLRAIPLTAHVYQFMRLAMPWLDIVIKSTREWLQQGVASGISEADPTLHTLACMFEYDNMDFLGLAIELGADDFAVGYLASAKCQDLRKRKGRPLLDIALNRDYGRSQLPSFALVARLLELGANPDQKWAGWPIWQYYFERLAAETKGYQPAIHTDITKLLVSSGTLTAVRDAGELANVTAIKNALITAFPVNLSNTLIEMLEKSSRSVAGARISGKASWF